MRIISAFFRWLCPCAAALALPLLCRGADQPDNVVLQYHFLGATQLARKPDVGAAKKVFAQRSTFSFENLVLNRLSRSAAKSLYFPTNAETVSLLRPFLDSLLLSESMLSVGGSPGKPLDFVLAIQLDTNRAQIWQRDLKTINQGPGQEFRAETFSGWQWNKGARNSFWMVPAGNWFVLGRGESLASVRSDYLREIQKSGRPGPALDFNCFEADVDWPRLANWVALSSCPLKLGRTQMAISMEKGTFHMTCQVTYREAIQWQSRPWHLPTTLVREPLVSFATGQDVEPFLKSDTTLASFCTNPLRDQFYIWSMSEMPLQTYMVWPVDNPSKILPQLASQVLAALNPKLQALDGTQLIWDPKNMQILWSKLSLTVPSLQRAPEQTGQFLTCGLFPWTMGVKPAPNALWEQFKGRTDLVYYDWEFTGARLRELRSVVQIVPILQMLGMSPNKSAGAGPTPAKPGVKSSAELVSDARLNVEEQWLGGLSPLLGNTVTEITKTGPAELTIIRNSPFVFSSLELLLLSRWLTDTPAGPINYGLLPQAKITGPGVAPH